MKYIRNEATVKDLKSRIQSRLTDFNNSVKGAEYKQLISTVRQYWAGADAEDWITDFEKNANNLAVRIKRVNSSIQSMLDNDLKDFKSFQSKNVTK